MPLNHFQGVITSDVDVAFSAAIRQAWGYRERPKLNTEKSRKRPTLKETHRRRREKRLVERALGPAGLTWKRFAGEECGVSPQFLRMYFAGTRDSARVAACVRRFIERHYPQAVRALEADFRTFQETA